MREKFERLDSSAMRTAMLFAWLFVVALCAFVIALNWHGMDFAAIPIAFVCFLSLVEFFRRAYIAYYSATYDEEDEEDSETLAQPPSPPNADYEKERIKFYAFVHSVVVNRMISESAWEGKELPLRQVREWFALLEQVGILSPVTKGQRRQVLVEWEEALETLERASGEPGYWKAARQYYNAISRPSSVLVIP
jgi:hypothetical protein